MIESCQTVLDERKFEHERQDLLTFTAQLEALIPRYTQNSTF